MSYLSLGTQAAAVGASAASTSYTSSAKTELADQEAADYRSLASIESSGVRALADIEAKAAETTAADEAYAARYDGAVKANEALVAAENTARVYDARAEADTYNAEISRQKALSAKGKAGAEANDFRRAETARVSTARARQAASGIALEGSPLMVNEALLQEVEFGAQRLVNTGDIEAARLRSEAKLQDRYAYRETQTAANARAAGAKTATYAVDSAEIKAQSALTSGKTKSEGYRAAADIKAEGALAAADIKATSTTKRGKVESKSAKLAGTADTLKGLSGVASSADTLLSKGGGWGTSTTSSLSNDTTYSPAVTGSLY